MAEHTPGRLRIDEWGGVLAEDGGRLLLTGVSLSTGNDPRMLAEANTARMVAAWNAHDDLYAACDAMVNYFLRFHDAFSTPQKEFHAMRAALAKARGEKSDA